VEEGWQCRRRAGAIVLYGGEDVDVSRADRIEVEIGEEKSYKWGPPVSERTI
jgi:hypothetical protein